MNISKSAVLGQWLMNVCLTFSFTLKTFKKILSRSMLLKGYQVFMCGSGDHIKDQILEEKKLTELSQIGMVSQGGRGFLCQRSHLDFASTKIQAVCCPPTHCEILEFGHEIPTTTSLLSIFLHSTLISKRKPRCLYLCTLRC